MRRRQDFESWTRTVVVKNEQLTMVETGLKTWDQRASATFQETTLLSVHWSQRCKYL